MPLKDERIAEARRKFESLFSRVEQFDEPSNRPWFVAPNGVEYATATRFGTTLDEAVEDFPSSVKAQVLYWRTPIEVEMVGDRFRAYARFAVGA